MLGSLSSNFAELNPGEPLLAPEHQSRVSYCFHVRMGFDEGQAVAVASRPPDAATHYDDLLSR